VVESLCAGVPVVSNNVGGTPELLRAVGLERFICDIDKPYDYTPIRLYHPPPIDRSIVAEKLKLIAKNSWVDFDNRALRIGNIARQYLAFFERLMR
jgi:glycosyltransferase involved in cell wall biosynthesis